MKERSHRLEFDGGWAALREPTVEELDAHNRTAAAGHKGAAAMWLYDRVRLDGRGEPGRGKLAERATFSAQMLTALFTYMKQEAEGGEEKP
jgi:hypothetical protein